MRRFNWKPLLGVVVAVAVLHALPQRGAAADFNVDVLPSISPSPFPLVSPSFAGYASNAIYALENGLSSYGTPGTPSYYTVLPMSGPNYTTTTAAIIATDFNSWNGQANPGGAFANEFGNFLNFGVRVTPTTLGTTSPTFTLASVAFTVTDTNLNPNHALGGPANPYTGTLGPSFGTDSFGTITYGSDNGGTSADITSGPDQPISALWYTGVTTAYQALSSDPGATNQDKINNLLTQLIADANTYGSPFTVTATYTVLDSNGDTSTGSATVLVTPAGPFTVVPEPASLLLWGIGAGLAGVLWRRRRERAARGP